MSGNGENGNGRGAEKRGFLPVPGIVIGSIGVGAINIGSNNFQVGNTAKTQENRVPQFDVNRAAETVMAALTKSGAPLGVGGGTSAAATAAPPTASFPPGGQAAGVDLGGLPGFQYLGDGSGLPHEQSLNGEGWNRNH